MGAKPIYKLQMTKKTAFIIGSEGHGIEKHIKQIATCTSFIPIDNRVQHLNASNAATIFAYEINRQLQLT